MSGFEYLEDLYGRRVLLAGSSDLNEQRTTSEYKEEPRRQGKLLEMILTSQTTLHRPDNQQLLVCKEELIPEQQERSHSLDQEDTEVPHIKEKQEPLWSSQEEQPQGVEETDTTELPFTRVLVKSEDEEKLQISQLNQIQTEHMETGADGQDHGGTDPARHLNPERHSPETRLVQTEDFSEPETDNSYYWEKRGEYQAGFELLKNTQVKRPKIRKSHTCSFCSKVFNNICHLSSHMLVHTGERPFICNVCGKNFRQKRSLTRHLLVHTGEKPFSCSECGRRFNRKEHLSTHMVVHRREKPFKCFECGFALCHHFKARKCAESQASDPHQTQKEGRRVAEKQDNGNDCGGAEPAGNLDTERCVQPDIKVKTEYCSDAETNDSGNWKYSGSVSSRRYSQMETLTRHKFDHSEEKPFSCSLCNKQFNTKSHLATHIIIHTGEKPFI